MFQLSQVSHSAAQEAYVFFVGLAEAIVNMKKKGKAARNYHSLRRSFIKRNQDKVPKVTSDVHCTTDGERTVFTGVSVLKRRITEGKVMRQVRSIVQSLFDRRYDCPCHRLVASSSPPSGTS